MCVEILIFRSVCSCLTYTQLLPPPPLHSVPTYNSLHPFHHYQSHQPPIPPNQSTWSTELPTTSRPAPPREVVLATTVSYSPHKQPCPLFFPLLLLLWSACVPAFSCSCLTTCVPFRRAYSRSTGSRISVGRRSEFAGGILRVAVCLPEICRSLSAMCSPVACFHFEVGWG